MAKQAELVPGTLELLILKAVSLGALHGYGVLPRIGRISGGGSRGFQRFGECHVRGVVGREAVAQLPDAGDIFACFTHVNAPRRLRSVVVRCTDANIFDGLCIFTIAYWHPSCFNE